MGAAQALEAVVAIQPGNAGEAWIFCAHVAKPWKKPARSIKQLAG